MDHAGLALKSIFGFTSWRPHQREIVEALVAGRDAFAALPTGGGKSLCYQLPSLLLPGLTIVVSPLIALMQDQVEGARQNGLAAAFLNSSLEPAEAHRIWHDVSRGRVRLLYVSPERISVVEFRDRLREQAVSLFAVDEAHCISEWGHEFRPDYRALSILRSEFPETPVAAFTATATRHVQDDVVRILGLHNPLVIRGDFDRREIFYRVRRKERVAEQIVDFVRRHADEPGIVYRATRKAVDQTASGLCAHGIAAVPYHAGLPDEDRLVNQTRFVRDEAQVVVATIAFGMGIDKSNVRWVLHGDLPRSLEAYYQETGRAGRDGEAAEACLLYGPADIVTIRYHIDRMEVPEERDRAERSLRGMLRYADSGVCRRVQLLAHFDQKHPGECGGCDVCADGLRKIDQTTPARMAMSAMVRTGQRFGAHHIADVVVGTNSDRVVELSHNRLPTFGVGSDHEKSWWLSLIGDLEAAGLVERKDGPKSGLSLTAHGRRVLSGAEQFLVLERAAPERVGRGGRTAASPADDLFGRPPSEEQEALFACLRALRTRLARTQGVPPYVIFTDRSLRELARAAPTDAAGFLRVHGVGARKADRYGEAFLRAIREFRSTGECTAQSG